MKIPTRTSSKRRAEVVEVENTRDLLSLKIKKAKKDLKPQASFDATYWTKQADVVELKKELSNVEKQLKIAEYEGSQAEWERTDAAEPFQEQQGKLNLEQKQCLEQSRAA